MASNATNRTVPAKSGVPGDKAHQRYSKAGIQFLGGRSFISIDCSPITPTLEFQMVSKVVPSSDRSIPNTMLVGEATAARMLKEAGLKNAPEDEPATSAEVQ